MPATRVRGNPAMYMYWSITTMGNAFAAFFAALQSFFLAFQGFGRAANNLADWADEATGTFVDEARADREVKVLENKARRIKAQQALLQRDGDVLKADTTPLPAITGASA